MVGAYICLFKSSTEQCISTKTQKRPVLTDNAAGHIMNTHGYTRERLDTAIRVNSTQRGIYCKKKRIHQV